MTKRNTRTSIAAALVMTGGIACSSSNGNTSMPSGDGKPLGGGMQNPASGTGGGTTPSGAEASDTPNAPGGPNASSGPSGSGGASGNPPLGGPGGSSLPPGPPPVGQGGAAVIPPVSMGGMSVGAGGAPMVPLTPKGKNCLQPGNGTYANPGPYKVGTTDVDLGMILSTQHTGKFTIYYPTPFDSNCLHPIVGWGNGTGVTDSNFTYQ